MYLFIVQHAPNLSKEEDPEEGLSQSGIHKAEKTAHLLKRFDLSFDKIVASTKKRAIQTAQIIAEEVGYAEDKIETTDLLKAMTPAEDSINYLKKYENISSLLLVGHLPSILNMLSYLLSSEEVQISYERAGICLVEVENLGRKQGVLKWLLPASLIEKIS